MKKRSAKIREQLLAIAKSQKFEAEFTLYVKEAVRLMNEGFTVDRVFSNQLDHPERENYLYLVSWQYPTNNNGYAYELYMQTLLSLV